MEHECNLYEAYGLSIRTDAYLPGLPRTSKSRPDVVIRRGSPERNPSEAIISGTNFEVTPVGTYLFFDGVGTFLVRGGEEVVFDPADGVEDELLRHFLLGAVMGVLLHQRGELVLHASCVAVGGGAVAFLGDAGWGKSTLAAALYARGSRLVADDVTSVRLGTDGAAAGPVAVPAVPYLKLWPETAEALGFSMEGIPRVVPGFDKGLFPARKKFSLDPLPLRRIYVLDEGPVVEIEPLGGQDIFVELVRNSFCAALLGPRGARPHFLHSTALAESVPVSRLKVPRDLSGLSHAAEIVGEDAVRYV